MGDQDGEDSETSLSTAALPRGKLKVDMPGVSDKPVHLVQEGVVCAIRMGNLPDSTLVARRIGTSEFVTVASPDYLSRFGEPKSLAQLDAHVSVNYFSRRNGRIMEMNFIVDGEPIEIRMRSKLAANDGDAYLQCGLQGPGLIQVPHFFAARPCLCGPSTRITGTCRRRPMTRRGCPPRAVDVGSRLGLPPLAPIEIAVYTRVRDAGMRETIRSLGAALRTTNASA